MWHARDGTGITAVILTCFAVVACGDEATTAPEVTGHYALMFTFLEDGVDPLSCQGSLTIAEQAGGRFAGTYDFSAGEECPGRTGLFLGRVDQNGGVVVFDAGVMLAEFLGEELGAGCTNTTNPPLEGRLEDGVNLVLTATVRIECSGGNEREILFRVVAAATSD